MKLRCRLHRHRWGTWTYGPWRVDGRIYAISMKCLDCSARTYGMKGDM